MSWWSSTRPVWGAALVVALAFSHSAVSAGSTDVPTDVRGQIAFVVASVGSVWDDEEQLVQFHRGLAERFKDTPELGAFRVDEQWTSVFSSRGLRYPGVFNARSKKSLKLQVGDIVRVRVDDYRKVDSYYRLTSVEDVLCRAADPDFQACAERHPLTWALKSGRQVSR